VHWDQATNKVVAYDDVSLPLTPPELMGELLDQALTRLGLQSDSQ
jgi:hypothetical protein